MGVGGDLGVGRLRRNHRPHRSGGLSRLVDLVPDLAIG